MMRFRLKAVAALAVAVGLALSACTTTNPGTDTDTDLPVNDVTLHIVGFAVAEAGNKEVQAAFDKTPGGHGITYETSYGASGDQSRAVVAGLEADYVHLSVSSDVTRLVDAGLVAEDWNAGPNKGIVSDSVVVLGVRPGNPKNIKGWDDIIKPGVGIVTANPASSGAARWNALAAWGHIAANGGTEAEAADFVTKLFNNVVSLPGSGRDATNAFLDGNGDVLLAYENEAILAAQSGEGFDWIYPDTTLLIENPGAVLKDADPKAQEYLDFILSADGQRALATKGFRPVIDGVDTTGIEGVPDPSNPFPAIKHLLTVDKDFESWSALSKKFFDTDNGIITKIIADSGKAA